MNPVARAAPPSNPVRAQPSIGSAYVNQLRGQRLADLAAATYENPVVGPLWESASDLASTISAAGTHPANIFRSKGIFARVENPTPEQKQYLTNAQQRAWEERSPGYTGDPPWIDPVIGLVESGDNAGDEALRAALLLTTAERNKVLWFVRGRTENDAAGVLIDPLWKHFSALDAEISRISGDPGLTFKKLFEQRDWSYVDPNTGPRGLVTARLAKLSDLATRKYGYLDSPYISLYEGVMKLSRDFRPTSDEKRTLAALYEAVVSSGELRSMVDGLTAALEKKRIELIFDEVNGANASTAPGEPSRPLIALHGNTGATTLVDHVIEAHGTKPSDAAAGPVEAASVTESSSFEQAPATRAPLSAERLAEVLALAQGQLAARSKATKPIEFTEHGGNAEL